MMPLCRFRSDVRIISRMPVFPESAIADEPALRFATIAYVRSHGGPIATAFVDALPAEWCDDPSTRIRLRPVWLRTGWSDGHEGWHLDGVSSRADGQEDWISGRPPDFERIGCNMGTNAPTHILAGDVELPAYPLGQPLGALWQRELAELEAAGRVQRRLMRPGDLFLLNSSSFHTLSPALRDGWRMFFDANRRIGTDKLNDVADIYNEVMSDFQATDARMEGLMSPYRPMDPRTLCPRAESMT